MKNRKVQRKTDRSDEGKNAEGEKKKKKGWNSKLEKNNNTHTHTPAFPE